MPDDAAQNAPEKYLSAAESAPLKMGWMQGFPPQPSKVLHVEDGSFMKFPALRWSVVHMRQMLPSVSVSAGLGAPGPLPMALDMERIDALTFQPWGSAKSGHPELKGWSYRDMWWMTENAHGAFAARVVYGHIYIDPAAEMVLVRLASHPVAANAANDPTSLPTYEAVAEYLMKQR